MVEPLRVGVQLQPGGAADYRTWRSAVIQAEDMGVDMVFGYDHFHQPVFNRAGNSAPTLGPDQPDVNHFEGWTALASWGELTSRVDIGLLVTGIGYRNPDLLADMARTVDHISNGRLVLGLGAGWYEKDYTTYGYDFGTARSRMELFDANLVRIQRRLAELQPPPLRPIPVLIGGSGVRRTMPRVARHADIWHSFLPVEQFRRTSRFLDELVDAAGRDRAAIKRAVPWSGSACAEQYVEAGATIFITQIQPTAGSYDFTDVSELLAWRDRRQRPGNTRPITRRNTMVDLKSVAHDSFRVMETGDVQLAQRIVAPDFTNQEADDDPEDVERQQHGPAGFLATSVWLRNAFSDLRFELQETLANGRTVMAAATMTGIHTGVFNGIEPTGKAISQQQVHIFTTTDGQISHHRAVRDDLGLLLQLGWRPGNRG